MADFAAGASLVLPINTVIVYTPGTHVPTSLTSDYQIQLASGRIVPEEDVGTRNRVYTLLAADITNLTTVANQAANQINKETLSDYTGSPSIRLARIEVGAADASPAPQFLVARYHVLLQSGALLQAQLAKIALTVAGRTAWVAVKTNVLADIRTFDSIT